MPITPRSMTFSCPACHWSKTTQPSSDVLSPADLFIQCPQCGNGKLAVKSASIGSKVGLSAGNIFKKLGR